MKLTKEILLEMVKVSVEKKTENEKLTKIATLLTSDDLSNVEYGLFLAKRLGHEIELQKAPSGFTTIDYNMFFKRTSDELYQIAKTLPNVLSFDDEVKAITIEAE